MHSVHDLEQVSKLCPVPNKLLELPEFVVMREGLWIGNSTAGFEIGAGHNLLDRDLYFLAVDRILRDKTVMYQDVFIIAEWQETYRYVFDSEYVGRDVSRAQGLAN